MTEKISRSLLDIQKKRARLAAVDVLRSAYEEASKRYNLTRKDFAERIGMSPSQFSRILNGSQNITIETAEAVLRSFGARLQTNYQRIEDLQPASTNRYRRIPTEGRAARDERFTKEPLLNE